MMAHCRRNFRSRNRSAVPRSSRNRVFAGVCGGLAEHFDVSANWLRVGFIIGTPLTYFLAPLLYVACILLMPSAYGRRQSGDAGPVVPPPIPKFATEDDAMRHLDGQFDEIEARIRELEDHVTSREYVLKRKFDEL